MSIFIPRWERFKNKKPPFRREGYEINYNHEFAQDLEGFKFNAGDRSTLQINPNSIDAGNRLRLNGTMLSPIFYGGGTYVAWNYIFAIIKDGEVWASDLEHIVISTAASSPDRVQMYRHNSSSPGPSMADVPSAGSLVETAMKWSSTGGTLFEDGSGTTLTVRGTLPFDAGVNRRMNVGNSTMEAVTDWAYLYSAQLSGAQRDAIFAAPYEILKPIRRFFAVPAAAAAASLTGTVTASITETDIVTGGKTIILTLSDDTFVADGATFNAERQAIIDGLNGI